MSGVNTFEARGFPTDMSLSPRCGCVSPKALLGSLIHAACIVQPTRRDFCSVELGDMVHRAGANKLHTTTAQVSVHIRDFKHDANLLHRVKGLDEITHHTPLNREDEEWLVQHRMAFSVSNHRHPSFVFLPLTFSPSRAVFFPVHVRYR